MKNVMKTASLFGAIVGLLASTLPSTAEAAPVACSTAFGQYTTADWLNVRAVRLGARWEGNTPGHAVSMANNYNLSTWPIGTSGAAQRSIFTASRQTGAFSGYFTTVHPDRPNTNVDLWEFWVYDSGVVWLRSVTWGGGWQQLPNRACFDGYTSSLGYKQTMVTGRDDGTNHTDTYWTFGLNGDTLF